MTDRAALPEHDSPSTAMPQSKQALLGLLAPYVAVLLLWCGLESAWASILAYHALILVWSRRHLVRVSTGWGRNPYLLLAIPCIAVGPLVSVLLPTMTRQPVGLWMADYGLTGLGRLLIIPYFGIVHPILEQAHWSPLRRGLATRRGAPAWGTRAPAFAIARAAVPHLAFAGYHMLVLASLLHVSWLWISFGVLVLTSVGWRELEKAGGLAVPVLTHILVDSGLVLAAVWRAS